MTSEICKIAILLCHQEWSWGRRIVASMASVMMPGFFLQRDCKIEVERQRVLQSYRVTEDTRQIWNIQGEGFSFKQIVHTRILVHMKYPY